MENLKSSDVVEKKGKFRSPAPKKSFSSLHDIEDAPEQE